MKKLFRGPLFVLLTNLLLNNLCCHGALDTKDNKFSTQRNRKLQDDFSFDLVTTGLGEIVDIQSIPNDPSLYIANKAGLIQELTFNVDGSVKDNKIFLDISDRVFNSGERGLLGFAFHPNYTNNGYFFVNYSCRNSGCVNGADKSDTIIARYNSNSISTSFFPIAIIPQPYSNHNGGCLQFSGLDGYLYIGLGDGGSGNDPDAYSQDLTQLLGKMLRVDIDNMDESNDASYPRWTVPSDNPFINEAGALDEIWAYGLRNPWRFSFDRVTSDMYIADVGQGAREEVNFQPSSSEGGENYGWRQCEGTLINSNYEDEIPQGCDCETTCDGAWVPPILDYGRSSETGGRSVTGGYVYRGVKYSDIDGVYFYADYASGNVWGVTQDGPSWKNVITTNTEDVYEIQGISTFGEDGNGELYIGGLNGGLVRIRGGQDGTDAPTLSPTEGERVYIHNITVVSEIKNAKKWVFVFTLLMRNSKSSEAVKGAKVDFFLESNERGKKKSCRSKRNGQCKIKSGNISVQHFDSVNVTVTGVDWKLGNYDETLNKKNEDDCPIFSEHCPVYTVLAP